MTTSDDRVTAPGPFRIDRIQNTEAYGTVVFGHILGATTEKPLLFVHLARLVVHPGQTLQKGQTIGYMSSSANSTFTLGPKGTR